MLHVLHKAALSRDGGGVLRAKYENDIFLCACASSGRWGYGNTSGGFMLRGIERLLMLSGRVAEFGIWTKIVTRS